MPTIPYFVSLQVTLSANQVQTVSYSVPQNWKMRIHSIEKVSSTGNFNITNIQNNNGINYSNATQSTPIDGSIFNPTAQSTDPPSALPVPLELEGAQQILIQLQDTSAAGNTIKLLLRTEVDYP